jgi:ribosomal protein L7/L12
MAAGYPAASLRSCYDSRSRTGELAMSAESAGDAKSVASEIKKLVKKGRTIEAIKIYREHHGCSLKEAKEAIDELSAQLRA